MKSAKFILSILFFAIATLLLAACGGGGGGGGGGTTVPTAPAAGVSITEDNAPLISADVLDTVYLVQGFSQGVDLLPGVLVDAAGSNFNYPDFIVQQLQRLPAFAVQANDSASGVILPTTTEACDFNHGTMTISGDVSIPDPYTPSEGDQITIKFNECELAGIVLNGKMSMTITELVGDVGVSPYTLGLSVVLSVFSANDGGFVASADGDIYMTLSENMINDETLVLSGNTLTAWGGGEVETLTDYQYDLAWEADGDYSIGLQGTLASTVIGGSVIFESTVPFAGNDFLVDGNPTAGVLWLTTSADASQALLTAQPDGTDVWIEVDPDGDGVYGAPIIMTWAELEVL